MIIIGLWIRRKVEDAPIFKKAKEAVENGDQARPTAGEIISGHWKNMLVGRGGRFAENILYYVAVTFSLTYLQVVVKVRLSNILTIMLAAAMVHFLMLPLAGLASDHFGRRPIFILGSILTALWSLWAFPLMNTGLPIAVFLAVASAMVIDAMLASPYPSLMTELFPTRVRATCLSICYQIAPILAGGFAPLIASALLSKFHTWTPIALYILVAAAITFMSILVVRRHLAQASKTWTRRPRRRRATRSLHAVVDHRHGGTGRVSQWEIKSPEELDSHIFHRNEESGAGHPQGPTPIVGDRCRPGWVEDLVPQSSPLSGTVTVGTNCARSHRPLRLPGWLDCPGDYDVTTLRFAIDEEDGLQGGPSKEPRTDPQVQVGLLVDPTGSREVHLFGDHRPDPHPALVPGPSWGGRMVADAGIPSAANLNGLEDAGFSFIIDS